MKPIMRGKTPKPPATVSDARRNLRKAIENVPVGIDPAFALIRKRDASLILEWLDTLDTLDKIE